MEPVCMFDLERIAQHRMPHDLWDFVEAGACDELTVRRNREALDEIAVNPRFLVDVSERDLSTTVLDHKISFPVMIAPAGGQRHVHPDGELASARAAGDAGTIYILPTGSGYSIEEVAEVATGPLWFQLYHFHDEVTRLLVTRAKKAGYKAICLTVDVPVPSPKERDVRNQFTRKEGLYMGSLRDYPELKKLREVGVPDMMDWAPPIYKGLTWSRLEWLRSLTDLPLIIKGIRTPEDAVLCAEHGADAIVVSNHGGRQIDSTPGSIETLPAIAEAVGDRIEIYFDSGVRRGMDVLKALALGARAVLMGRPMLWGLAYNGEAGVKLALDILRVEFDRAMACCGRTRPSEIDQSAVSLPCTCGSRASFSGAAAATPS